MYRLGQLLAVIVGQERTVALLRSRGHSGVAWELQSTFDHAKLRNDPTYTYTYTYTFESAAHNVHRAELATEAKAFEWAYLNATDALAILEWRKEQDDPLFGRAQTLASAAAEKLPAERLEDVARTQEEAKASHNTWGELRFKERLANRHLDVWKRSTRIADRPRIDSRPN